MSATDDLLSSTQLSVSSLDMDVSVDPNTEQAAWVNVGHQRVGPHCIPLAASSGALVLNSQRDLSLGLGGADFDVLLSPSFVQQANGVTVVTWNATGVVNNAPNATGPGIFEPPFGSAFYTLSASSAEGGFSVVVEQNNTPGLLPCDGTPTNHTERATLLATLLSATPSGPLTIRMSAKRTSSTIFDPFGNAFPLNDDFKIVLANIVLQAAAGTPLIWEVGIMHEPRSPLAPPENRESHFSATVTGVPAGRTPTFKWEFYAGTRGLPAFVGSTTNATCTVDPNRSPRMFLMVTATLLGVSRSDVDEVFFVGFKKALWRFPEAPPRAARRVGFRSQEPPLEPVKTAEANRALQALYADVAKATAELARDIEAGEHEG
jgi:hypothetical protein